MDRTSTFYFESVLVVDNEFVVYVVGIPLIKHVAAIVLFMPFISDNAIDISCVIKRLNFIVKSVVIVVL